ncbi:thiolase [Rhodococcus triatomae BKS 15-14]|nr:thiolase [Rhodococcus triatomae BKS 15-14]
MTPFGVFPEKTASDLARQAVGDALVDSGCVVDEIEFVAYANAAEGSMGGQHSIRGEVALRDTGLLGRAIVNVENACASGSTAFRVACLEVASGAREVALAVGVEKMSYPDKGAMLATLNAGTAIGDVPSLIERLGAREDRSIFMDIYADAARKRMARNGLTPEDFAKVVEKSRWAGSLNPRAQFRQPVTVDEVLSARKVVDPLTLPMCSPMGDGAAAVVVMSAEAARRRGIGPVFVRAVEITTGLGDQAGPVAADRAARAAYEKSGVDPGDVHVAEVHDATATAELGLYEDLGFCAPGDAAALIRAGHTSVNGRIAVNSGGGLLSRGHPIAATGCAQIVELVDQLRGRAGRRQREGATVALAENGGGWLGDDAAVAVVSILST